METRHSSYIWLSSWHLIVSTPILLHQVNQKLIEVEHTHRPIPDNIAQLAKISADCLRLVSARIVGMPDCLGWEGHSYQIFVAFPNIHAW